MSEPINELVALLVGLVVLWFVWQSLTAGEQLGRGRGRQLRHGYPTSGSGVRRPRRG